MRTMSEEGRTEAIGRVTDCRTSNQMGTREREMPEPPQIYTLPAPRGDLPHKRGEQKAQGGRRKYGQQVRGQTLREGERRKRLEGGERETEEPESAATSAGSYLDQPFFHSGRSWTPASVHLPPACWSAMGGLLHISSSYPEAEKVNKVKIKQTGSILAAH